MDALQIRAYLDRIGAQWPKNTNAQSLRKLTRAHLEQVPFENLQITETSQDVSLEEADLYHKVVDNRRGGFCFELNKLYFLLLKGLGFQVDPVPVRVLMGRPEPCPFSHRGTLAVTEEGRWYVDVGFGGLGPKGIINVDIPDIQTIVGEHFRVVWEGNTCVVIRVDPGKETRMLAFRNESWLDVDFKYWSGYFASSPNSPFRNKRVCYLCTPTGWLSMVKDVLTVFDSGVTTVRELNSEEEIRSVITEQFHLLIPEWSE